jgi:hypothetical protein
LKEWRKCEVGSGKGKKMYLRIDQLCLCSVCEVCMLLSFSICQLLPNGL